MSFEEVLDQAIELLRRRGRLTYRALERQFNLDDEYLEILKDELIYGQQLARDEEGRVLVWTSDPAVPEADAQRDTTLESRFYALLPEVMVFLQRNRRATYRRLRFIFGLDDKFLEDLRKELTFQQVARDELGQGLVWTGEVQPVTPPAVAVPSQPVTADPMVVRSPDPPILRPPTIETRTPSYRPTGAAEVNFTGVLQDEPAVTPESIRTALEAERRQLTVMFCDLADSTKLSQKLDPEDLREVVRAYQETAAAVIHQYEGHIAQYLGDGLLIYFGWPRAHEDDAQRALHAGLGIVDEITTRLNPRLEAEKGVQLTVRLGVHTGLVVVGEMGGRGRHENLATGETVNVAARLEGLAAPNTVVISNVTARLVQDTFTLEALRSHTLKGVAEPMLVFRVLGLLDVHASAEEIVSVGIPFLVGRDEEVGLLRRRWEQAKEGLGQVVMISGEAGIGKSSLVGNLRAQVREENLPWIAFRCSPYHQNSALYPVIEHVQRVCHFHPDDTPETRLDKLERTLQAYDFQLEEVVPLLATLLSVPLAERYPPLALSPQQQKQQMQDILVAWLLEEAERQSLVAVWEDLHWADPSTLELLGFHIEQAPTAAMLHVFTFRPEFTPPWLSRSHITPMTLNRLERPQVEAMITHLTGGKNLPAEVVEHIVTKTDGVPLYVEELTKMLLESALLCDATDHYILRGPLSAVPIPATLQDSLMARLDQLNKAKDIAQLGAVLGREFTYDMLKALAVMDEATLQVGLAQLVKAELLYQRGRPPRAKYIFKHALIQDAAYQTLLKSTRQQIHQQVAQLLEERFPETAEWQPELVAHHYAEAGQYKQATIYWQRAGQRANERSAHVEGLRHLTQGLGVLKMLPDTPERAQQELVLQTMLGSTLIATKGYTAPEVERAFTTVHNFFAKW